MCVGDPSHPTAPTAVRLRQIPRRKFDGRAHPFHYEYHFDELDNVWHFFIYADPRPASNEMFDMTFTPINETTVRQTSIFLLSHLAKS